jgi:tetratricopeptide (TPR) repeat protein
MDLMFKPNLKDYAYGWYIDKLPITESKDSLNVVTHMGGLNGFSTYIYRLIDDKHLIVIFNNVESVGFYLGGMNDEIINILYGKPYDMPKKCTAEILYKTILKKDVASALKHIHELKDMYPDDYDFGGHELERLGDGLTDAGMLDEAIEIYKLILELYPYWGWAYNGIADVYRMKGEKELAIKYYAKSLEMNTGRWNVKQISEKLKELTEKDN